MGETKEQVRKQGKFKSLQSEFKKIVWPDKLTLFKQSVAVIFTMIFLGALITIVDIFLKYGIDFLVQ